MSGINSALASVEPQTVLASSVSLPSLPSVLMEYLRTTVFRDKDFEPSNDVIVSIGMTSLSIPFWIQLVSVVLLGSIFNALVAILVYKTCLRTNKPKQPNSKSLSYLVGYGFVIPFLLFVPFGIAQSLELRNGAIKVAAASGSVLLVFRCLEAMHGTAPTFATSSGLRQYVLYYVATIQFDFDDKTGIVRPATAPWLRQQLLRTLQLFLETAVLFSILIPRDFQLLNNYVHGHSFVSAISAHLVNNLAMAMLTSLCLDVGATGMGLVTSAITGRKTVEIHDHPITRSTSPGNFWGQRWNVLVGSALKRGIYVPLRRSGQSRAWAAFVTFVASGLLHEYVVAIIVCQPSGTAPPSSSVGYLGAVVGRHSLFFMWNGVVLMSEYWLRDTKVLQWMVRHVPRPVRTALVVMTVLPFSHLFTSVYVETGFYKDFGVGFPRFVLL
jgi:Membrane bound O-acyl transferase family